MDKNLRRYIRYILVLLITISLVSYSIYFAYLAFVILLINSTRIFIRMKRRGKILPGKDNGLLFNAFNLDDYISSKGVNFTKSNNLEENFIIKEVFRKQNYSFTTDKPTVCIDIGANIGITSIFFSTLPNVKKIYSFEPFKSTYDKMLKNLDLNPKAKKLIKSFNYGLSDKKEDLMIDCNSNTPGCNSTVVNRYENFNDSFEKEKISLNVASKDIKAILDNHKKEKIVLKIDTEGSEYKILKDLNNSKLLKRVDCIMIEWHKLKGIKDASDTIMNPNFILDILHKNGFVCFMQDGLVDIEFDKNYDYTGMIYGVRQ
ncbi:MAG: FkbM family methyltransferase [Alphaproteobacteria bacterium]|nr:FkbM family methyltransferase [Alphaproteobacteria bacterium]